LIEAMDIVAGSADRDREVLGIAPVFPIRPRDEASVDGDGFDSWYRRAHPRLVAALFVVTGDLSVASESVDEAFARALERWDRVGAMDRPSGWVFKVALNVSRRTARRAVLERRLLRRQAWQVDVPAPAGEVWSMVADLPRREREVVVLRHMGGFGEAEIAACLGISRSTVSTTLRSAHHRLFQLLEEGPDDHD
jgi:RNA polymerase sigma-70 factor (ECF subfamily)